MRCARHCRTCRAPRPEARHQLEAIIEAALLPDTFNKARLAREAMHPMEPVDGFTNVVRLNELDPGERLLRARRSQRRRDHRRRARDPRCGQYLVRAELYEFLCEVIKKELRLSPEETRRELELNELEKRMTEALLPDVGENADAVLHHLHPIDEKNGFTSEIFLSEVDERYVRPVRNVLTAGSSLACRAARPQRAGSLLPARRALQGAGTHPCARRACQRARQKSLGAARSSQSHRPRSPTVVAGRAAQQQTAREQASPIPRDEELRPSSAKA